MSNAKAASAKLAAVFDAERAARDRRDALADEPDDVVVAIVSDELPRALAVADAGERTLRLVALADALAGRAGARAVDLLVDLLGSDDEDARHAAGLALEEASFDRFKEVALGVERALARLPHDSPALSELPYLLIEVPEPGVSKLLGKFLAHPSAVAVAAAIEATVELGDARLDAQLARLEHDDRTVELDDDDELGSATIGELATEARALLESALVEDR